MFTSGCKEYRKVDSVLRSVEEEKQYGFTGGHFLKKLIGFKTCITITQTISKPTFVKLSEKNPIFYYGIY